MRRSYFIKAGLIFTVVLIAQVMLMCRVVSCGFPLSDALLFLLYHKTASLNFINICIIAMEYLLIPIVLTFLYLVIVNRRGEKLKKSEKILFIAIFCIYFFVGILPFSYDLIRFEFERIHTTRLFDDYYVSPKTVKIKFPNKRKNLIIIFMESIETSFSSKAHGGVHDKDYIPELTSLALENINFSNQRNLLNGSYPVANTNWTTAGMIAVTAGIPVKVPLLYNPFKDGFYPKLTTLNDILADNGYHISFFMGSDSDFGGCNKLMSHGGGDIFDVYPIDNEYHKALLHDGVFYAISDKYLFEFAKRKLLERNKEKPFSFTILTLDTHGDFSEISSNSSYLDKIHQGSKLIGNFIDWCKKQDFYKDTLFVIVGDHPTMQPHYIRTLPKDYLRKVYASFSNSSQLYSKNYARNFSPFDLFPTIIAALGGEIEGERLGLGVNLFSDKPTLIEKLGYETLNREIIRHSQYYEDNFY